MKKIVLALLSLMLVFAFVGCGGSDSISFDAASITNATDVEVIINASAAITAGPEMVAYAASIFDLILSTPDEGKIIYGCEMSPSKSSGTRQASIAVPSGGEAVLTNIMPNLSGGGGSLVATFADFVPFDDDGLCVFGASIVSGSFAVSVVDDWTEQQGGAYESGSATATGTITNIRVTNAFELTDMTFNGSFSLNEYIALDGSGNESITYNLTVTDTATGDVIGTLHNYTETVSITPYPAMNESEVYSGTLVLPDGTAVTISTSVPIEWGMFNIATAGTLNVTGSVTIEVDMVTGLYAVDLDDDGLYTTEGETGVFFQVVLN